MDYVNQPKGWTWLSMVLLLIKICPFNFAKLYSLFAFKMHIKLLLFVIIVLFVLGSFTTTSFTITKSTGFAVMAMGIIIKTHIFINTYMELS